ncbi:hypothetical protein BW730_16600 [Tessaracoccus aquimaris]|uniref:histidine kinase n=1 Tax=Tessaracoccus aquimaris TaxID=1332264 RepID=A0A1Q2CS87_9ACTN|nr:HAMP domain-containing sensor histidine kinase [Tessaracoccus aquimaris]AQP48870.1 hypothetical protein BW730_16600 [Tessaracoccus aquimaris]
MSTGDRKGSLASQVQPKIVLTVAVMALLICLGTVLSARFVLYGQLDRDLMLVQQRQGRGGGGGPDDALASVNSPGNPPGTVIVAQVEGRIVGSILKERGVDSPQLTKQDVIDIYNVDPDGQTHSVGLQNLGKYRVQAFQSPFGKVAFGLPTSNIDRSLLWLTTFAAGVSLIALAATAFVTREVLHRATRKLVQLTVTADDVSRLELERGAVEVPRVEVSDLPENNEVTRLGSAFNHMLANVENALTSREASETKLRRFVADASHELRNPLAAIRGYAELAQRAPGHDDAQFAMGRIESESTRMSKLVNDLLLLARLDSDAKVAPVPVDAVEVLVNAVSDAQAASGDHRWLLDVPNSEVTVLADPDQLHQVMVNLLSNARTHTPPGTSVQAGVHVDDGRAVIEVSDDGPGIAPETLPRVFERFTKADAARAHTSAQSTGLGLAIVKAMVESWGGTAEVASRPGLTTFRVLLPLDGQVAVATRSPASGHA